MEVSQLSFIKTVFLMTILELGQVNKARKVKFCHVVDPTVLRILRNVL